MQRLFLYSVYSGQLFFIAAGVFAVAAALDVSRFFDTRPTTLRAVSVAMLLSIALAVLAAPPLPRLLTTAALIVVAAYAFLGFGRRRFAPWFSAAAVAACLVVAGLELPHHLSRPRTARPQRLFVIGDSLASGGFGEVIPWPDIVGRYLRAPLMNLARPSDNAAMALRDQVPQLPASANAGDCVVIEVGGNDMLEGLPLQQFASSLDRMLAAARAGGTRTVIMLELPLLPGRWRYGTVQRAIAAKNDVVVVPKRILARVLVTPENTADGIHLTQRGHDALARELIAWLGWGDRRQDGRAVDGSPSIEAGPRQLLRGVNPRPSADFAPGAGAPASSPCDERCSSTSGQLMTKPPPTMQKLLRCSSDACNNLGYQARGTVSERPSRRSILSSSSETRTAVIRSPILGSEVLIPSLQACLLVFAD